MEHTSPAKGELGTLRNRKRHYDKDYCIIFHGVSQVKVSAYAKGHSGFTAHLCVRFF
jgi:hypothetical protein